MMHGQKKHQDISIVTVMCIWFDVIFWFCALSSTTSVQRFTWIF